MAKTTTTKEKGGARKRTSPSAKAKAQQDELASVRALLRFIVGHQIPLRMHALQMLRKDIAPELARDLWAAYVNDCLGMAQQSLTAWDVQRHFGSIRWMNAMVQSYEAAHPNQNGAGVSVSEEVLALYVPSR